jgi:hypothetical protein
MTALAILLGLAMIAGVVLYLGNRWIRLQERGVEEDARPEEDDDEPTPARAARMIREGPGEQARLELDAWVQEQKRKGLSDGEVQEILDAREPLLFI